ncbi:MAG: hypothetical protein N3E45_02205 [Oscillatoriaceae bacterium SKW80]|nr:hypothetical protein [Oscillatoriaceae bacterium SKYG93]MCX8119638.1 hypothetical protein [Oscillatoriaceae bacterium SKW80]MDW8455105.1 hypothetical protein [Oscillatoriaceae cyanobacterium SKYGB_i_bin93]HIK28121.1 hypothetical protein [Oscillatoriaceae cyanobacterium M7585_C2015_266]
MYNKFIFSLAFAASLTALTTIGSQLPAIADTTNEAPEISRIPVPATAETSASALAFEPPVSAIAETSQFPLTQRTIQPGRATRSGSSYIGIGLNIGVDGDGSSLGEGAFAVFSKIGMTRELSLRPAILLGDNAFFSIPLTIDFAPRETPAQVEIAPYLGGGVAFSTGDDSGVGGVVTAGIDVPLTPEFTATAAVNIGILTGNFDIGILVGGAYNFSF